MIKSIEYTSKYHNQIEETRVKHLLRTTTKIKNQLSQYVYEHKQLLLTNSGLDKLKSKYKIKDGGNLLTWNIRAEYLSIINSYYIAVQKHLLRLNIGLQDKILIQRYVRNTKFHKKGDTKCFTITYRYSKLTMFITHLVHLDHTKDIKWQLRDNKTMWTLYEYYESKNMIDRIIKLAYNIQQKLFSRLKPILFNNKYCSLKLDYKVNQARIDYIPDNTLYKYWFVFKMHPDNSEYRLPLQINENNKKLIAKEFTINLSPKNQSKISIITTYEVDDQTFKPLNKVVGMDLNLKNNFATLTDGFVLDYDRTYIERIVQTIKELDKIGYRNLTKTQRRNLKKIYRQLDLHMSMLIHKLIAHLVSQNITDIVVENLLFCW